MNFKDHFYKTKAKKKCTKSKLKDEDVQDILGVPSHGDAAHFGNAQEYSRKPYMRSKKKIKIDVDLSNKE